MDLFKKNAELIHNIIKRQKGKAVIAATLVLSALVLSAFNAGESKIYVNAYDTQEERQNTEHYEIITLEEDTEDIVTTIEEEAEDQTREKTIASAQPAKEGEEESELIEEKLTEKKIQKLTAPEEIEPEEPPTETEDVSQAVVESADPVEITRETTEEPATPAVQEISPQEPVVEIPVETAAAQEAAPTAQTEPEITVIDESAAQDVAQSEAEGIVEDSKEAAIPEQQASGWTGSVLTKQAGVNAGPSGKETYYNLPMGGVVNIMRNAGFSEEEYPYWVREDGAKMLGDYVMVAADLSKYPRGSIVESSLGSAIVSDTGDFCRNGSGVSLDIAVNW